MGFIVHRPGTYSLLVDGGHPSSRHLGIPLGGPADRAAWTIGNALVGNQNNACALEITLQGPTLEATDSHTLVVFGADLPVKVTESTGAIVQSVPTGHVFPIESGQLISIGAATSNGLRAYLCVARGWRGCSSVLQPIQSGAKLECGGGKAHRRWVQVDPWPNRAEPGVLRYLPAGSLTNKNQSHLEKTLFTVRAESNRMGLRLESSEVWEGEKQEMLSAPVVPGTIQLPGGGQPIILGVDAQTIGGYPRLGDVISADLDQLGQLRPGDSVRFESTTQAEAEKLRRGREDWLRSWVDRLRCQQID
jgi:biotin-dependent carboxylase-like uncharacterized protein